MFVDRYREVTESLIDLRRRGAQHRVAQAQAKKSVYESNAHLPHNQREALASHAASEHTTALITVDAEISACLDQLRYFDYALKALGVNLSG